MEPTSKNTTERLKLIDQLKSFLVTAPDGQQETIKQHPLSPNEFISCVKWNDAFYISGTDIVRSLVFRFHAFGRPVRHLKKFEEGIFSDLRNLKHGTDAILEGPKSPFLDLLFQNNCIRTQKKQKVFYWYSVPHDRLFLDALERDLKREKMGIEPTTVAVAQPAVTISLDTTQAMFDNVRKTILSELNISSSFCIQHENTSTNEPFGDATPDDNRSNVSTSQDPDDDTITNLAISLRKNDLRKASSASTIFGQFSLFEGSPTYKQRRRRVTSTTQQQQIQQQILYQVGTNSRDNHSELSRSLAKNNGNNDNASDSVYRNKGDGTTTANSGNAWRNNDLSSSSNNNTDDDISSVATRYFNCPLPSCDKYFKRLEHMKRHLRTHTMERPYMCELCGKRFSRSDNFAQHKKTHDRNKTGKILGSPSSPPSRHLRKTSISKTSGGIKLPVGSLRGYLGKSITKSFPPAKTRSASQSNNHSKSSRALPYSNRSINRGRPATSRRLSLPISINSSKAASNRLIHQRRQPTYPNLVDRGGDDVETEAAYDPDWIQHHNSIEYQEQSLQPELSISTTSSSTASSYNTSPTSSQLPTIKIEDLEPYSDIQHLNQMEDTAMMMVEEFVPQEHQYHWEDESASDWQRRVDWNQYSSPAGSDINDTEDIMVENYSDQQESLASFPNYYYLSQPSPYNHYDVSNTSSCLASPTMLPAFLIKTTTTSTSNSTVTTAVNSPIMMPSDFNYFSDESPTITPSDALLQPH
ncbi:unnamed protein product [Mucor hiemalis]